MRQKYEFTSEHDIKRKILWFSTTGLSTHSPIQPVVLLFHNGTYNYDYTQLLYKAMKRRGLCILECLHPPFWYSLLLLLIFMDHDPIVCWNHIHAVICLFYNKHNKVYTLLLSWEAVILTFFDKMGIHPIYINYCWKISMLLHQWTSMDSPLKNTNKPSKKIENTVHNHSIPCSP